MISVSGHVIYRGWKNGRIVDEGQLQNRVVYAALQPFAQLLGGEAAEVRPITHIAWGAGIGATDLSTTAALEDQQLIKPITAVSFPSATQIRLDWSLGTTEGNSFSPTEWALLQDDGEGGYHLFSRLVRPDFVKQVNVAYEGHWTIDFQPKTS